MWTAESMRRRLRSFCMCLASPRLSLATATTSIECICSRFISIGWHDFRWEVERKLIEKWSIRHLQIHSNIRCEPATTTGLATRIAPRTRPARDRHKAMGEALLHRPRAGAHDLRRRAPRIYLPCLRIRAHRPPAEGYAYLAAGATTIAIVPYTFVAMMPTNNEIERLAGETEKAAASDERVRYLMQKWYKLNLVRSIFPLSGFVIGLLALGGCFA